MVVPSSHCVCVRACVRVCTRASVCLCNWVGVRGCPLAIPSPPIFRRKGGSVGCVELALATDITCPNGPPPLRPHQPGTVLTALRSLRVRERPHHQKVCGVVWCGVACWARFTG